MTGGFTFDGIDIADLGLEYVPDNQNTYVYKPSQWNMNEESFDAHDGGYFYGTTVKPKDFTLRCIYEDSHVNSGGMTRLFHAFKRGRTGRLIFAKRPWCWYVTTVVSVDISQMTNYMNGVVTINMRAYYPFARTDKTYITDADATTLIEPGGPTYEEDLMANTAMLKGIEWDLQGNFAQTPITQETAKPLLLYNPGTENAPCAIEIAGNVGGGITIANRTTGQKCEVVGLNTSGSDYIIIDALSGKVLNQSGEYAFLYHDNGFIDLESGYPLSKKVHVTATVPQSQTTNVLTLSEPLGGQELVGKYINMFIAGSSAVLGIAILGLMNLGNTGQGMLFQQRITSVSEDGLTLTVADNLSTSVSTDAQVVSFNEIIITPKDTMNITKLIFRYRPTFA